MIGFSGLSIAVLFVSTMHFSMQLDLSSGRDRTQSRWSNFWGDGGGKERRAGGSGSAGGGTLGLFPFPRVGRAYHAPQQFTRPRAFQLSDVSQVAMKRQGLIPFPRVGRSRFEDLVGALPNIYGDSGAPEDNSDPSGNDDHWKRASDANSGMWFGPRLGKRQFTPALLPRERDQLDRTLSVLYGPYSDLLALSKDFTPRLGREQDETDLSIHQQAEAENETS